MTRQEERLQERVKELTTELQTVKTWEDSQWQQTVISLDKKLKEAESELSRLRDAVRWRDAEKEPPEQEGRYAVIYKYKDSPGREYVADWGPTTGWYSLPSDTRITHWLPIPSVPNEGGAK